MPARVVLKRTCAYDVEPTKRIKVLQTENQGPMDVVAGGSEQKNLLIDL